MNVPVLRQEIGETRQLRFDFTPALLPNEALSGVPTVTATRLTGTGTAPTVSAIALSPDSREATCLVATPSAGRFRLAATGAGATQTIVIFGLLDVGPLPT